MAPPTLIPCSSASRWNYDVYLSYQGGESGSNFATELYASLEGCNIKMFKDDGHVKMGEHLSATLREGIKGSRIAIIIYSRNYASSSGCLEENALIMECREELGQKVFPVFLMGVDGSDVRRQKGCFEEPFRLHQEMFDQERVDKWRSALKEAGEIRGWNLKDVPFPDGDEEKLIEMIVKEVLNAQNHRPIEGEGEGEGVDLSASLHSVTASGCIFIFFSP